MITGLNNNVGTAYTKNSKTNSAQNQNKKAENGFMNGLREVNKSMNNLKSDNAIDRIQEIGKIIAGLFGGFA